MRADLHIHTYHSDGSVPPEKLIDMAEETQLDYLAITDHDCLAAYEPATREIARRGLALKLIPAAEFTATLDGEEVHIHGYFKNSPSTRLLQYATMVQTERRRRVERAIEMLATVGVQATMEDLPADPHCLSLTQLHLAFLLMKKKYAATVGEARRVFLTERVLPKFTMRAEDVIETIISEEGLAVWAHPEAEHFDENLRTLMAFGLDGIEVYNLRRQDKASKHYIKAAKKNKLLTTLGSDWHGHHHKYASGDELKGDKILGEFLEELYR